MCTIRQRPEKLIHCIVWAKALFEGVYGPSGGGQVFEDIIEELESARKDNDLAGFVKVLFDRVYGKEPQHLIDSHGGRLENGENELAKEELEETKEFLAKIRPLKLESFEQAGAYK